MNSQNVQLTQPLNPQSQNNNFQINPNNNNNFLANGQQQFQNNNNNNNNKIGQSFQPNNNNNNIISENTNAIKQTGQNIEQQAGFQPNQQVQHQISFQPQNNNNNNNNQNGNNSIQQPIFQQVESTFPQANNNNNNNGQQQNQQQQQAQFGVNNANNNNNGQLPQQQQQQQVPFGGNNNNLNNNQNNNNNNNIQQQQKPNIQPNQSNNQQPIISQTQQPSKPSSAAQSSSSSPPSQSTSCLTWMYFLAWLISTFGTVISLMIIIIAKDLIGDQFDKTFALPSTYWAEFNFILLYNPFTGIVTLITSYILCVACCSNYNKIHHTQTVSLVCSILALVFGICNFTQMSEPIDCSGTSELCVYATCSRIYYFGVIEIAGVATILLMVTQWQLGKIQKNMANGNNAALQAGQMKYEANVNNPIMINNNNNNNNNQIAMPVLEQCPTPTDQNGKHFFAYGDTSQNPLNRNQTEAALENPASVYNGIAQNKGKNSSTISNNFGISMANTGIQQIELESQEPFTPLQQQQQQQQYQANRNNNNNVANGSNLNMMKTTQSYYQNTPTKDLSPIQKLTQNAGVAAGNSNEQRQTGEMNNRNYNPFGAVENGEIQLGKHPYLANVGDPHVGKMLDQVHQMVNSQVKSLIVDLKKMNKI